MFDIDPTDDMRSGCDTLCMPGMIGSDTPANSGDRVGEFRYVYIEIRWFSCAKIHLLIYV